MKKIIRIILTSVLMCMFLMIPVSAYNEDNNETPNTEYTQEDYAFDSMSRYINASSGNSRDTVYISSPVVLNSYDSGIDNKTVYFAIDGNTLIGMLTVDEVEGKFVSSYMPINFDELNFIYESATPFSLNIINESLILSYENKTVTLIDSHSTANKFKISQQNFSSNICTLENTEKKIERTNNAKSVILNMQLSVNRVVNPSNICWAAVVAQNVNYMNGTSYTAQGIYNLCSNNYSGTPVGNEPWLSRAYNLCGVNVTVIDSARNYSQVYGLLSYSRPLHIRFERTDALGTKHAHGVSISGITVFNSPSFYAYYYIVDPNVGTVSIEVPYSTMLDGSDLTYATSYGYTYTEWTRTIYKS